MRKERALLQLRGEIAHEQQLIDQARQRLRDTQSRSSVVDSPPGEPTRLGLLETAANSANGQLESLPSSQTPSAIRPTNEQSHPPAPSIAEPCARATEPQAQPSPAQPAVRPANNQQLGTPTRPQAVARTTNEQSRPSRAQPTTRDTNTGQPSAPPAQPRQVPSEPVAMRVAGGPANGQSQQIKRSGTESSSTSDTDSGTDSNTDYDPEDNIVKHEGSNRGTNQHTPAPDIPPALTVGRPFQGTTRKEFHIFMVYLQSHFRIHADYFRLDFRKIREACRHLSEDTSERWTRQQLSRTDSATWTEFCDFLRSQLPGMMHPRLAIQRYESAKQKPHQSVRDFANYLGSVESQVDELVTDQKRFERMWTGVFGSIVEKAGPRRSGMSFDDYVSVLQEAKYRMPNRLEFIENKRHGSKRRRLG